MKHFTSPLLYMLFLLTPSFPGVADSEGNLLSNGTFEQDTSEDGQPDAWPPPGAQLQYVTDAGNTFLRLTSLEHELVSAYRRIHLPSEVEALELRWRWRVRDLEVGVEPWHDARILLNWVDAKDVRTPFHPSRTSRSENIAEWESVTTRFLVPENAVALEVMPGLFKVARGVLDVDDIKLVPTDPRPLREAKKARDDLQARLTVQPEDPLPKNWPPMLRVEGTRLVNPDGEVVRLHGVNIPSLGWRADGEHVLRSIEVAVDNWGANVIRLPVNHEFWFGEESQAYRERVDHAIVHSANRGAYVILDLHQYRAPRREHLEFWQDAAARYSNHPALLFDLLNEPHNIEWETWRNGGRVEVQDGEDFESVGMQALVDTVRAAGAWNIVLIGGLDWAYDLSGILEGYAIDDHPRGNGVMYSTHVYPWKRDWEDSFLKVSRKFPVLVGEFGADERKQTDVPAEQQEDWRTWVPRIFQTIHEHELSWTGWSFHPQAGPRMITDWEFTPTEFWGKFVLENLQRASMPVDAEVVFRGTLENANLQTPEGREAWGIPWMSRVDELEVLDGSNGFPGQKMLRVTYPRGGVGPGETGLQFPVRLAHLEGRADENPEALYFRYYVHFEEGFDFRLGGKLPGLMGGDDSWNRSGGDQPDGTNGWTLRLMWQKEGKAILYAYLPEGTDYNRTKWGTSIPLNAQFLPGEWHRIEQWVRVNTIGQADGQLTVWMDGAKVLHLDDIVYRTTDTPAGKPGGFYFSTFHGGNTPEWAPESTSHARFGGFLLAIPRRDPNR